MSILVIGGAGYIGSHMVHALIESGKAAAVLDDLVVGETGGEALISRLIAERGISAIIHFAASIVVPDSAANPLGYYRNNTVNSRALIECAVRGGVKQVIFSSTVAVYGNPTRVPVSEDDALAPLSP
jgi:UDP-glucose 4-epimerase